MTRCTRLALFALLSLTLGGCTFTYIPLVRKPNALEPRLLVADSSHLRETETGLELILRLETVPKADWLAVQWFDPSNEEVYATSLWLEPAPKTQLLNAALSPQVEVSDGLWRVVISYESVLERQFSVAVGDP